MSLGKAVVTTRVGGIPEMITSGISGLLVAPGNQTELSEALVKLANDKALRENLGRTAKSIALQKYDMRRLTSELENWYRDVLSDKG